MLKKYLEVNIFISCTFICLNIIVSSSKRHENFDAKIVGGKVVELEQYPFAIQFYNKGSICGGVILNSWSVLTSGHCLVDNQKIEEMRIQIGSKYVYDFNAKKHELDYFVVHEDYSKRIPFENDIAVLFVKQPFKFNTVTKKGILVDHKKWMCAKEKHFTATGWGWLQYGGDISKVDLRMATLAYVPAKECSRLHNIELSEDMFCLYGDGERDTCKGDSGGGVLWHERVVGLTSHGDGCGKKDKPSIYTNLWYQRPWIEKQVETFKKKYCFRLFHSTLGMKQSSDELKI